MTTSVKGEDRLEEIAELVDPWPFQAWRKYVAEYVARGTDEATAHVAANARYGQLLDDARAKARQIAALPCKGGEPVRVGAEVYLWDDRATRGKVFAAEDGGWRVDWGNDVKTWHTAQALTVAAPSTKPDRESADEGALTDELVAEVMQDTWDDICTDTDCHPLDIEQLGRRRLSFTPRHWSRFIAGRLRAALSKDTEASAGEQSFGVWGASNEIEALACALWAHRCPGLVMGDDDLPYYEAAARAAFAALDGTSAGGQQ